MVDAGCRHAHVRLTGGARVMCTSWSHLTDGGPIYACVHLSEGERAMAHEGEIWTFLVNDTMADRIFLVSDCDGGAYQWIPMERVHGCRWEVTLPLPPGRHRMRYYRFVGQTCINAGSDGLVGRCVSGQDQAVQIETHDERVTCGRFGNEPYRAAPRPMDAADEGRSADKLWPMVEATQARLHQIHETVLESIADDLIHDRSLASRKSSCLKR